MKKYLYDLKHPPRVLEIGVDRGVSYVTLATFLTRAHEKFEMIGVDVLVQEQVVIMANNLDRTPDQRLYMIQDNSLKALPAMAAAGDKFDLVLLDGDHNYYTVNKELSYLNDITMPGSMVLIDDYSGRWAERDLWYAARPEYADNASVTVPVDGEKHGVKPAVDEFLSAHPEWKSSCPVDGEPIMLVRQEC